MTELLDPLATPANWRAFLYDQVLLPWETQLFQCRPGVYSNAALDSALGLHALKKKTLAELQTLAPQLKKQPGEYLAFYCDGKGYEVLFKRLRDSVAHAHYTQPRRGWIKLSHGFQGIGDRKPKLRLIAHMRLETLKRLVAFINVGSRA